MFIFFIYLFYIIIIIFILVVLTDITYIAYFLGFFYNFSYLEEIVSLLEKNSKDYINSQFFTDSVFEYYLVLKIGFLKLFEFLKNPVFNFSQYFIDSNNFKKPILKFNIYGLISLSLSTFFIYKFFFRNMSFYGASARREDWFVYQDWFRVAKGMTPREMQVFHRLTALSNQEFNNLLKTLSVELVEEEGDEEREYYYEIVVLEHRPYKDIYKSLYYYFLSKNEERLLKNAINTKNVLYYKDRYGADVFSYLTSTQDEKMAKTSSVKTFKEYQTN